MQHALTLLGSVAMCLSVGFLGSFATRTSVDSWYAELWKPLWTPPNWLFGPVWTLLYVLMGFSVWLVWRQANPGVARGALLMFGVQLALNLAWSFVFFGMRSPGLAFVEIVLLWAAILATAILFAKTNSAAAWLLAPYLAWVSYAAALNFSIWRGNA